MAAKIGYQPDNICVLRVSGTWKRSELGAGQKEIGQRIDAGIESRLLAILEDNFEGWERDADWNDLDFLFSHSDKIAKIAIVADQRWEVHALGFAGAGVRRAPVKFFRPNELEQARTWLGE
jgi:hypothetical protein